MRKKVWKWGSFVLCGMASILVCVFAFWWITATQYTIAGVPVLNYHQVNDKYHTSLTMEVAHFRQQMKYLCDEGYTTINLDQLYDYLEHGTPLPPKPILITFDDGYIDNYKEAFPILKEYHMKATLFMIGDAIDTPRFLSAEQLLEMDANGFSIESHTYTHRPLVKLSPEEIEQELQRSRIVLESLLGHPVRYIAYPGGFANETIKKLTAENGYRLAFTVESGNVKPGQDCFALRRLPVFEGDNAFLSMRIRLHFADYVRWTWQLRDYLRDHGYPHFAAKMPLF